MKKIFLMVAFPIIVFNCNSQTEDYKKQTTEETNELMNKLNHSTDNWQLEDSILNVIEKRKNTLSNQELIDIAAHIYINSFFVEIERDSILMKRALNYCNMVIKNDSLNKTAYDYKANFLLNFGKYNEVILTLKKRMKRTNEYPEGVVFIGLIYEHLNQLDSANFYYNKGVDLLTDKIVKDDKLDDKIYRASIYCLAGNKEKGVSEINKLQKENPNNEFVSLVKNDIDNFDNKRKEIIDNSLNISHNEDTLFVK